MIKILYVLIVFYYFEVKSKLVVFMTATFVYDNYPDI